MATMSDYLKYFISTEDGVLVDAEIFKHREELGEKVWILIDLMCGCGSESDIGEFEHIIDDSYLIRKRFDAVRSYLFDKIVQRDGKHCQICGTIDDLTIDHIVPVSRGGTNDLGNLRILCRTDNSRKGAK